MKVYISGTFTAQRRLREVATRLHALGHLVTSSWLNEIQKPAHLTQVEWDRALALKDLVEVAAADAIIMDIDEDSTTGGRYVEWGFAVGRYNTLKWLVGKDRHGVFNSLADQQFDSWDDVYACLEGRDYV